MHTGVKQSKSLGMGFRCESELLISSSPDTSDLTSYGHKAGTDLAKGAGAQSIPKGTPAHQEGWKRGIRLQPARACDDQSYQRHVPGLSSYPRTWGRAAELAAALLSEPRLTQGPDQGKGRHSSTIVPCNTASMTAACAHPLQTDRFHRHRM